MYIECHGIYRIPLQLMLLSANAIYITQYNPTEESFKRQMEGIRYTQELEGSILKLPVWMLE